MDDRDGRIPQARSNGENSGIGENSANPIAKIPLRFAIAERAQMKPPKSPQRWRRKAGLTLWSLSISLDELLVR
jgi:hypothetical protein